MKTIYAFSIIPAIVVRSLTITAQQTLTLEQCRETALRNNKTAAAAEQIEAKAGYEAQSYRANYFPRISAAGAYLYSGSEVNKTLQGNYLPTYVTNPATGALDANIITMPDGSPLIGADGNPVFKEYAYFPDMPLKLNLNGTYMAGIHLEQPVFTGGKISSAYRMSRTGKEIAALNKTLTRVEIIVQTDEAYWLHLKTIEMQTVAVAFSKVVAELYRNVQDAYQAGMKSKNDVLKVQVQVNRSQLQLQQAENAIRLSKMNLCHAMGIDLSSDITVSASTADALVQITPTDEYANRPEYAILNRQIELKDHQIALTKSDFLPNVGVTANYGYMHGLELNGEPLISRASFSALLSVKIPLFHQGEGKNKINAAKADKLIMQLQRDELNEKMKLELAKTQNACNESATEVAMTARALEQAEENMQTCRNHYQAGMETLAN
ncbi:MAG: TolC family protein, partial [Bacteroidales bacterium]|nr:TolC family protein [Bacteroidales bacterium]